VRTDPALEATTPSNDEFEQRVYGSFTEPDKRLLYLLFLERTDGKGDITD